MTLSFKKLLTALLALIAGSTLIFSAQPSHAASDKKQYLPVTAVYLVRDESGSGGYKEKVRWVVNGSDIWDHLNTMLPLLAVDRTPNADPLTNDVDDIIVLTRNELNGMTGLDVYLSSIGIMTIERGAEHAYFADTNMMWDFLDNEQGLESSFKNFTEESEINKKEPGIVATLNLNQNLPNPHWVVNDPEKVKLYNSYLKGIKAYSDWDLRLEKQQENFDALGLFVLYLNYKDAPAEIATISKNSIRLSNSKITTTYLQDSQDQYPIFRRMAKEVIAHNAKYKKQEVDAVSKREF
jgi:hypothetical protein